MKIANEISGEIALLEQLICLADDSLRHDGDRRKAASFMSKASEILFRQAKNADCIDRKRMLATHAANLLDTAIKLGDFDGPVKPHEHAVDVFGQQRQTRSAQITFDDIAGLVEVKQTLMQRLVFPLRYPEKIKKYRISTGGGMLLFGPSGTGKTLLARAIAGETGLPFFVIKSSEILSMYYGQSEKQLADLFAEAKRQPQGAVVFLDEIDAIGAKRSDGMNEASRRLINQLLQELDGVEGKNEKMIFIAATNEPWLLDEALLRPPRFVETCFVPLPDESARLELFQLALSGCPVAKDVLPEELIRQSDGFSGADIVNLCERAKLIPFCESISTHVERAVNMADFRCVMSKTRPSVNHSQLTRYINWINHQCKGD